MKSGIKIIQTCGLKEPSETSFLSLSKQFCFVLIGVLVSEEVRHSNKAWRAKHYEQRKAKEKSLDYYQAKVDQVNEKRLLEKNATTILIWWDKRFDSETHPFMEKSVLGFKKIFSPVRS